MTVPLFSLPFISLAVRWKVWVPLMTSKSGKKLPMGNSYEVSPSVGTADDFDTGAHEVKAIAGADSLQ